jgi:multisubunit Na+/H+ antiporter MnhB subunit
MTVAIVILSCLVILAVSGFIMFRHRQQGGEFQSGSAEAMLGVIGTLFSVLLGLLVAGAIERYHDVAQNAESEANGIGNIYRLARGLQTEDRKRIRGLCREYVDYVIDEEWPLMARQQLGKNASERYAKLWDATVSITPTNDRESNVQSAILDSMDDVGDDRRARAVVCMRPLPVLLWAVITCGSLITIAFTYLFTQHMGQLHWMMTFLVAISLGLNVWLLAAYSTPFSGDLALTPDGFLILDKFYSGTHDDNPAEYIVPQAE